MLDRYPSHKPSSTPTQPNHFPPLKRSSAQTTPLSTTPTLKRKPARQPLQVAPLLLRRHSGVKKPFSQSKVKARQRPSLPYAPTQARPSSGLHHHYLPDSSEEEPETAESGLRSGLEDEEEGKSRHEREQVHNGRRLDLWHSGSDTTSMEGGIDGDLPLNNDEGSHPSTSPLTPLMDISEGQPSPTSTSDLSEQQEYPLPCPIDEESLPPLWEEFWAERAGDNVLIADTVRGLVTGLREDDVRDQAISLVNGLLAHPSAQHQGQHLWRTRTERGFYQSPADNAVDIAAYALDHPLTVPRELYIQLVVEIKRLGGGTNSDVGVKLIAASADEQIRERARLAGVNGEIKRLILISWIGDRVRFYFWKRDARQSGQSEQGDEEQPTAEQEEGQGQGAGPGASQGIGDDNAANSLGTIRPHNVPPIARGYRWVPDAIPPAEWRHLSHPLTRRMLQQVIIDCNRSARGQDPQYPEMYGEPGEGPSQLPKAKNSDSTYRSASTADPGSDQDSTFQPPASVLREGPSVPARPKSGRVPGASATSANS